MKVKKIHSQDSNAPNLEHEGTKGKALRYFTFKPRTNPFILAGVICRLQVSGLRLQVSGSAGKFILRGKISTIAHAQSPNRERAKNCESTGKRGKTSG